MSLATTAAVVGIGAGVYSMSQSGKGGGGSSGGGSGGPNFYVPQNLPGIDNMWQNTLLQSGSLTQGIYDTVNPAFAQSYLQQMGIDPYGYAMSGQQAGQAYGQNAANERAFSDVLGGQFQTDQGRQQALWQAGADPQSAMYNHERQQVVDSSRAADSARGLAMSPYSSGNESAALNDFNRQWDYGQLQRMMGANQGANQTGQLMGADLAGSAQFGAMVPQDQQMAGAAPIQGQMQAAQYPAQAAAGFAANTGISNQMLQQYMNQMIPYMNYGQGAQQNAYNAFSNNRQFDANQSAAGMNAVLTGLKGASSPGSWMAGWGGGGYSGAGSNNWGSGSFDPGMAPSGYYGDPTGNIPV